MRAGDGGREIEHTQAIEAACRIPLIDFRYGHPGTPFLARPTADRSWSETLEAAGSREKHLAGQDECFDGMAADASAGNANGGGQLELILHRQS
jgi:hypothetical protein